MKHAFASLILAAGLAVPSIAGAADPAVGYDRFAIDAPHRAGKIAASLWYPVGTKTYIGSVGESRMFEGARAYIGATIADGRYPLVLLSHGSGGNMDGLAWLSSRLAASGALVLAVNHPGSTTGDSSPRRSVDLKSRAADLTTALDWLMADSALAPHVDPDLISVLGFSLGGATALNLIGLQYDKDLYRRYCEDLGEQAADCVFFAKGGVDFANLPAGFVAEMRDSRIGTAVAIDPALTFTATQESIAAADTPVLLLSLGTTHLWPAVDVSENGSDLAARLPGATHVSVAPAHHFTFLPVCKDGAREMLAQDNDDPICDDPENVDRAAAHQDIADEIIAYLKL